jgi:hypothetical protein
MIRVPGLSRILYGRLDVQANEWQRRGAGAVINHKLMINFAGKAACLN